MRASRFNEKKLTAVIEEMRLNKDKLIEDLNELIDCSLGALFYQQFNPVVEAFWRADAQTQALG